MSTNAPSTHFSPGLFDENGSFNGLLNNIGGGLGQLLFGDYNFVGEAVDELSGYNSQQREFEWNDERNRMKRLTEAGINANTAGQTIAGSFSGAASPSNAPAQGLAAAVGTGEQIANAVGQFAGASKTASEIDNLNADSKAKLAAAGLSKWEAIAIEQQLPFIKKDKMMDIALKVKQIPILEQQYKNMKAEHTKIMEDINLSRVTQGEVVARTAEIEEKARWQKQENDFAEVNGFRRGDPIDSCLIECYTNKGSDKANELGDILLGYHSRLIDIQKNANIEQSWKSRPTTPVEAAAYAASLVGDEIRSGRLGQIIEEFKGNVSEMLNRIKSDKEANEQFEEAYDNARDELKATYRKWRKEYRQAKYSSASDSYKSECKRKRDEAYNAWQSFTRETFSEQLVKQISPN